jgi:hypothetical protein
VKEFLADVDAKTLLVAVRKIAKRENEGYYKSIVFPVIEEAGKLINT